MDDFFNLDEACRVHGVCRKTMERWVKSGKIHAIRRYNRLFFRTEWLLGRLLKGLEFAGCKITIERYGTTIYQSEEEEINHETP